MKVAGSLFVAVMFGSITLLPGCAGTSNMQQVKGAAPLIDAGSAAITAFELSSADEAFTNGDDAALSAMLSRLINRGVRPLNPEAETNLTQWAEASEGSGDVLRGRALGPGFHKGTLRAGGSSVMNQIFLSGEATEIAVGSKDSQPLRFRLLDAKSRMICDFDPAQGRACRFTPVFTQRYSIELINGGRRDARYFLVFD